MTPAQTTARDFPEVFDHSSGRGRHVLVSATPAVVASKSWGNQITRICTWARFIDGDGRGFYHFNLHLDHQSQPSRDYRIHFKPALKRPEHYEKLMATMKSGFVAQGKQGIVKARAVEDRLMRDTWELTDYDLMPKLASLRMPTLVLWGDYDFIPVSIPTHIAQAIPGSRLVTLKDCGHFAYLECPLAVRAALDEFLRGTRSK